MSTVNDDNYVVPDEEVTSTNRDEVLQRFVMWKNLRWVLGTTTSASTQSIMFHLCDPATQGTRDAEHIYVTLNFASVPSMNLFKSDYDKG